MYYSVEVYTRKRKFKFGILPAFFVILDLILLLAIILGFDIKDIAREIGFGKGDKDNQITANHAAANNIDIKTMTTLSHKGASFLSSDKGNHIYLLNRSDRNSSFETKGSAGFVEKTDNKNNGAQAGKGLLKKKQKTAYLTFDDGPSPSVTPEILRILDESDIKATFFVLGEMCGLYPEILKQQQAKGHLICNHTYSHDYKKIYASTDVFLRELTQCENAISTVLGSSWDKNKIIRFPGGGFGKKFNPFKEEIKKYGYTYYNWNALNGDAEGRHVPVKKLVNNTITTTANKNEAIILMHDSVGKETTVKALPDIIQYLKEKGYVFETLKVYPNNQ